MGDQCYFTQFHLQGSLDPTARGGGGGLNRHIQE